MIDLFRPYVSAAAIAAVAETLTPLADGRLFIGQGPKVEAFEKELQGVFQTERPPLTTNSCTSALDLALHLCGVDENCRVVTTPMTCSATNTHLVHRGTRIVWADVDHVTGLIDPKSVAKVVERWSDVAAVIAVDWGGRACDYHALRDICQPQGIPIIEDAAHAALAQYQGRSIGYMGGDYVAWSFQAIKHLTTVDGGALLVPEAEYERAKLLRWYGLDRTKGDSFRCSQDIPEVGYKYHMNDVAAAIGLANLKDLPDIVYRHRQNALWYTEHLADVPGITLPPWDAGSSWWLYTLLVEDRDDFMAFLAESGIASSPVHARNDWHTGFGGRPGKGGLPGVDAFAAHEVAIPVGWWLTKGDLIRVSDCVWAWAQIQEEQRVSRELSDYHTTSTASSATTQEVAR